MGKAASRWARPEAGLETGTVACPTHVHRKAPLPTALRGGTTGADHGEGQLCAQSWNAPSPFLKLFFSPLVPGLMWQFKGAESFVSGRQPIAQGQQLIPFPSVSLCEGRALKACSRTFFQHSVSATI